MQKFYVESIKDLIMYRDTFEKEYLFQGKIPHALFLYGQSAFLINLYIDKILLQLQCKQDEKWSIYFDEYDIKNIVEIFNTPSLFAPRNIVLLKMAKKISKKDMNIIFERLEGKKNNYFILAFYHADNRQSWEYSNDCKEIEACFKKRGVSVRFFAPSPYECIALLKERAIALHLDISEHYLAEIIKMQNGDLMLIESDLHKLCLLGRKIEHSDIKNLIYGVASWEAEDICKSLFLKNEWIPMLENMLNMGVTGREIINSMESFFMKLFLIFSYSKVYGTVNFVEILGYKPPLNITKNYVQWSSTLKEEQYRQIFEILQSCFLNLLLAGVNQERELYSCLMKLKAIFR